jgi:rhamnulokinase
LWQDIVVGLTMAARKFGDRIETVGVDTWGVDYALLSKSRDLLSPAFHYRDSRTRGSIASATRRASRQTIFQESGAQFLEINTLYQLIAHRRDHPDVLGAARHFLMIPDFFHWCLCGSLSCEFTNATTTQMFNPSKSKWSSLLLKRFGLPGKIMPQLVVPGTPLGPLLKDVAVRTGLKSSVQVIAPATHDTAAAVAAVPTIHTGKTNWAYLSSGTWSLLGIEVSKAHVQARVRALNLTNEGGVANTYRLLKNIAGLWLLQRCKHEWDGQGGGDSYAELATRAEKTKPSISFIDPDDPDFTNPVSMPQAIKNSCKRNHQPVPTSKAAMVRCILESLALKYSVVINQLQEISGQAIEAIHVVGGGSQNELLNQFTADACNCEVIAGPVEATAMGNILTQLLGLGKLKSLAHLRESSRRSSNLKRFRPNKADAAKWLANRNRFEALLK